MYLLSPLLWHLLLGAPCLINGLDVNVDDRASLKKAAGVVAEQLVKLYNGTKPGAVLGIYGKPYYWWQSGVVWSGLIDYQAYTSDDQYQDTVQQALLSQIGPDKDYMPPNQTKEEGNDDQGMWALAAMNAAEKGFPHPSSSPAWIDLAKNVFNSQAARWDNSSCGGGLRWQIFAFNKGYDYKNAASQATFFLLAARLAQYTKNETYADWANKAWDWTKKIGLIGEDFRVYDGAQVAGHCGSINRIQWSHLGAAFTYGSAVMYNHTLGDKKWQDRTESMATVMSTFWPGKASDKGVMVEVACESHNTCTDDQFTFKGLAAQWLGQTIQLAASTGDTLYTALRPSAVGAGKTCSGGKNNNTCSFKWTSDSWDGSSGVSQELNAMNIFLANLAAEGSPAKITASNSTINGTQSSSSISTSPSTTTSTPSPSSTKTSSAFQIVRSQLLLAFSVGGIIASVLC